MGGVASSQATVAVDTEQAKQARQGGLLVLGQGSVSQLTTGQKGSNPKVAENETREAEGKPGERRE